VRTLKELIRFGALYVINNPNFQHFEFTRKQIFQLWGDLFYWALLVNGFKPCLKVPGKTKCDGCDLSNYPQIQRAMENIVHQPAVLKQQVDIAVPDTVPVVAPKSASRASKQVHLF
jgi:hypothetical protein